jgi:hypothetical protein
MTRLLVDPDPIVHRLFEDSISVTVDEEQNRVLWGFGKVQEHSFCKVSSGRCLLQDFQGACLSEFRLPGSSHTIQSCTFDGEHVALVRVYPNKTGVVFRESDGAQVFTFVGYKARLAYEKLFSISRRPRVIRIYNAKDGVLLTCTDAFPTALHIWPLPEGGFSILNSGHGDGLLGLTTYDDNLVQSPVPRLRLNPGTRPTEVEEGGTLVRTQLAGFDCVYKFVHGIWERFYSPAKVERPSDGISWNQPRRPNGRCRVFYDSHNRMTLELRDPVDPSQTPLHFALKSPSAHFWSENFVVSQTEIREFKPDGTVATWRFHLLPELYVRCLERLGESGIDALPEDVRSDLNLVRKLRTK